MTDPRLIDMEPGGESTQYGDHHQLSPYFWTNILIRYESIRQYTISPSKQTGQLGCVFPPRTLCPIPVLIGISRPTTY